MNTIYKWFQRLTGALLQVLLRALAGPSKNSTVLEVERKFRLVGAEADGLPEQLKRRGFLPAETVDMTDTFLPCPVEGDMARVRVEKHKGTTRTLLTLKTWMRTPDGGRERQETEKEIGKAATLLLLFLGRKVAGADLLFFGKRRRHFVGHFDNRDAVVTIDTVDGLGQYSGLYLEIEVLVPLGEDVTPARQAIVSLAADLLGEQREQVQHSYMEMLKLSRAPQT